MQLWIADEQTGCVIVASGCLDSICHDLLLESLNAPASGLPKIVPIEVHEAADAAVHGLAGVEETGMFLDAGILYLTEAQMAGITR